MERLTPHDILGPEGSIARRLAGYEERPQQLEMADGGRRGDCQGPAPGGGGRHGRRKEFRLSRAGGARRDRRRRAGRRRAGGASCGDLHAYDRPARATAVEGRAVGFGRGAARVLLRAGEGPRQLPE